MTDGLAPAATTDRQDWEDTLRAFLASSDDEQTMPAPPIASNATVRRVSRKSELQPTP